MPKRLRHVHGTKELPRGRQCIIYRFDGGQVLADRVHPDDRNEMLARLKGHYGENVVTVYSRDMRRDEQYVAMDHALCPQDTRISAYWLHDVPNASPDGPGCPVCHATDVHECECGDPEYDEYIAEWRAAVDFGEFDEFVAMTSYFVSDMIPGITYTDFIQGKAAA